MFVKKVTCWSRIDSSGLYSHHNLSDGWDKSEKPTDAFSRGWENCQWNKKFGYVFFGKWCAKSFPECLYLYLRRLFQRIRLIIS